MRTVAFGRERLPYDRFTISHPVALRIGAISMGITFLVLLQLYRSRWRNMYYMSTLDSYGEKCLTSVEKT